MTKMQLFRLWPLSAVLLLSACMLGVGDTHYRLVTLEPDADMTGSPLEHVVLAIARPRADRTRDSSRILVRQGRSLMPWSGVAWVDRAPDLVQTLLVEALDGHLATVVHHGSIAADYRLDLELRRFEMIDGDGQFSAQIQLTARLRDASGALLAVDSIDQSSQVASQHTIDSALSAMEIVMESAIERLAAWLRRELQPYPR